LLQQLLQLLQQLLPQLQLQQQTTFSPRGGTLKRFIAFCRSPDSRLCVNTFCTDRHRQTICISVTFPFLLDELAHVLSIPWVSESKSFGNHCRIFTDWMPCPTKSIKAQKGKTTLFECSQHHVTTILRKHRALLQTRKVQRRSAKYGERMMTVVKLCCPMQGSDTGVISNFG